MVQVITEEMTAKATALMADKGLVEKGWVIRLNNRKTHVGFCNYRDKTIYLSKFIFQVMPEDEKWDTITHEIAHAIAGAHNGHNHTWKAVHRSLGGSGNRTYDLNSNMRKELATKFKWVGVCPKNPEHTFMRHRLTKVVKTSSCSKCSDRYDANLVLTWTQNH